MNKPVVLLISTISSLLCVESAHLKPLQKSEAIPNDRSDEPGGFKSQASDVLWPKRVRRNIPDWDAANPNYVDQETQQDVMNPQDDESSFALADHVSSLFRNHENAKDASQKDHRRALPGEEGLTAEGENVEGGLLPPDEQEECYRQQNIDPPPAPQRGSPCRRLEKPEMKFNHPAGAPDGHHTRVGRNQGRPFGKTGDSHKHNAPGVVMSLYSDPENASLVNKNFENRNRDNVKNIPFEKEKSDQYEKKISHHSPTSSKKNSLNFEQGENQLTRRVYKPTELKAEFPVYDDDIEFRPDPLQGLLDDKYWGNQQDRGSVIKKYIDLAFNNMVPSEVDVAKRNIEPTKLKCKPKFRDDENICNCNQDASCKDCKKGRLQEVKEEKTTTSRTEYKENCNVESTNPSEDNKTAGECGIHNEDTINGGLMLLNNYDNDDYEETKPNNIGESNFNNIYIGRKLLSWDDEVKEYGENEDEEIQDESLNQEGRINNNEKSSIKPTLDNGEGALAYNNYNNYKQTFENSQIDRLSFNQRNTLEKYGNSQNANKDDEDTKRMLVNVNFAKQKSDPPILAIPMNEISTRNPRVYVPNKLENMLQKASQEKPKGPTKKTKPEINPNKEFETIENQLFANVTLLTPPNVNFYGNKTKGKVNDDDKYYFQKGRRSLEEFWPGLKRHPVSNSYHKPDGNTSNSLNQSTNDQSFAISTSTTTAIFANTTKVNSSPPFPSFAYTTPKIHSNNQLKAANEDSVDAEIANDIVETVFIGSQKDTVLGHDLGLSRRNKSSMNAKYGRIVPETEKIIKGISDCIMGKMKDHLARQSCILLDTELLDFLKWMVLTGDSYRDYSHKVEEFGFSEKRQKVPSVLAASSVATTCKTTNTNTTITNTDATDTSTTCELELPEGLEFGISTAYSAYK